jgi:hypothetical protein
VEPFPSLPQLRFNAGAAAFLNFADTTGHDLLDLNGAIEQREIGKSLVTFGAAAGVGAELDLGAVTLFASYRYVYDETTPIAPCILIARVCRADLTRGPACGGRHAA